MRFLHRSHSVYKELLYNLGIWIWIGIIGIGWSGDRRVSWGVRFRRAASSCRCESRRYNVATLTETVGVEMEVGEDVCVGVKDEVAVKAGVDVKVRVGLRVWVGVKV